MTPNGIATVLAVLNLALGIPLILWLLARLNRRLRQMPGNLMYVDRRNVAWALLLLAAVFGPIFLNNDMAVPILDGTTTKLVTRSVVLLVIVVPTVYYLWIDRNGG